MPPFGNTVAMAGAAPCKHCGRALHRLLFDASGRVEVPSQYRDSSGNLRKVGRRSKPLFQGYSIADAQAGLTAPGAVVCLGCDAPDPKLTLDHLAHHLKMVWNVETLRGYNLPEQPESD